MMKHIFYLNLLTLLCGVCSSNAQTTLNPTADSYVRDGTYATSNFGTATALQTKTNSSAGYNRDAYFKFDLSTVSNITSAKLRLYANLSGTGSVGVSAYPVSITSWAENTITWNNKPALGASALASVTINSTSYASYEMDVTGFVQSEKNAGRNIISIALRNPASSNPNTNINSREASANKPQLVITSGSTGTCGSASGGPTDNPVATKYGSTAYTWTSNIKWNCVFNINNYSGASADAKFNAARDAAAANGGGVVHLPSGTYNFSDNLYLKNGVVIRGANPSSTDAKISGYNPPSKMHFPKYNQSLSGSGTANSTAFKKIYTTTLESDSNIGVVNVDINRAGIRLEASTNGLNKNILVFGVRVNNCATPDSTIPTSWQNAWQRWPYRFDKQIAINASANVLVANNRINDAITDNYDQPGYLIKDGTTIITLTSGSQAPFDYTEGYAIYANWPNHNWYGTPATDPGMFRNGIVVRDNWMYQTKRVGISASGQGVIVKDNIRKDKTGKVGWVYPDGQRKVSGTATYENRGIHMGGYGGITEGNDLQVEKHQVGWTPAYSVNDGEGIMMDNNTTMVNGWTVRSNKVNQPIMIYRPKDINNAVIISNTVTGGGHGNTGGAGIYVWADIVGGNYKANNVKIDGNTVYAHIDIRALGGGTGNSITNNNNPNGNGQIKTTCATAVTISGNTGFTINACTN